MAIEYKIFLSSPQGKNRENFWICTDARPLFTQFIAASQVLSVALFGSSIRAVINKNHKIEIIIMHYYFS